MNCLVIGKRCKEKGITHQVWFDLQLPGVEIPETIRRYRTRGTPQMAIIGRQGIVRFQRFGGFDPEIGERLIDRLLNENINQAAS